MKAYLPWLAAVACACGGSGGTGLGDGGNDATTDVNNGMDVTSGNDASDAAMTTDSAGDGSDGSTFNVASVPGLALWLRGDLGITKDGSGNISEWADQSGNSNNAVPTAPEVAPTFLASGINSLNSVHFTSVPCNGCAPYKFLGNDLNVMTSASMNWGTNDYLVEVVSRYTNDPTSLNGDAFGALFISIYGPPVGINPTTGIGLYANVFQEPNDRASSSGIEAFIGGQPPATSAGTGYNSDAPHIFGMQRSGTSLAVRVDGASVGTSTIAAGINIGNQGARMGGCENASAQRLEGDIAEVIAVEGTVAPSDLANIEAYLQARYGTP